MTLPAPEPRTFRLQFSLRMLLLLMAVMGVGLTIFRWPWVEVTQHFEPVAPPSRPAADDSVYGGPRRTQRAIVEPQAADPQQRLVWEKRTSYRRNWRGQPVKHGSTQHRQRGLLINESHFHDDQLHGRRMTFDRNNGRLLVEEFFRDGLRHGPFRGGNGEEWIWHGNYELGLWHGKWKGLVSPLHYYLPFFTDQFKSDGSPFPGDFFVPFDALVLESEWQQGQRHGHWRWLTREGKLIRSADYERDELVRWNDQPVVAEFWQWLDSVKDREPQLVKAILATQGRQWCWRRSWEERMMFQVDEASGESALLPVHLSRGNIQQRLRAPAECGSFVPYLCEIAALNSCLFEARYGTLWLIGPDGKWADQDPTGIADIHLPAGSPAAKSWQEPIPLLSSNAGLADCLTRLLRGTEWTCDISAVAAHRARNISGNHDRLTRQIDMPDEGEVLGNLRRCDAIGLTLFLSGCRGELQGNKLIVTPRSERPWSEPILYPHLGTSPLLPLKERGKISRNFPQPIPAVKPDLDDPFK